jgi:glutamate N-acetyltransferase/amino-acid N-acetyltransferase
MDIKLKEIAGGVCAPKGFRAGGVRAGIKASAEKLDLAIVASDAPCQSAAVFTRNVVQAANIIVSQENHFHSAHRIRALVANSGNANACTGEAGLQAAQRMADLAAEKLGIPPVECAVASTGVIGVPLPIAKIEAAMDSCVAALRSDAAGAEDALTAIMTTDTRKKQCAFEIEIPFATGGTFRIGAMAKGSGMIHPNMGTMIAVITTDAKTDSSVLALSLESAVRRTFNRLTVDGDTSTNDMVLLMANGAAGNPPIELKHHGYEFFSAALTQVCTCLVKMMARDGEGATKLVSVTVRGAEDETSAAILAKSVAGSNLVKAACFGADANWGRVLCALGYAGEKSGRNIKFDPDETAVAFSSKAGCVKVFENGTPINFSEDEAKKILSEEEIEIQIEMQSGKYEATAWGCDLTYDYVKINGDYRT